MEIQKSDVTRRMEKLSPAKRQLLLKKLAERSGEDSRQVFRIRPRDGEEIPLSYGQSRLWLLEQLDQGSAAYVILAAARLRGRLDVAALRRGLGLLVGRHESLRTVIREGGDGPFQEVRRTLCLEMPVLSLEALPPERREARVEPLARLMANIPFDLSHGPLVRLLLIRLGREEHVLVRAVHHIVSDGWSDAVFYRELLTAYRALAAGEEPRLGVQEIQYADFVRWQRQQQESGAYDAQLAYWREQLAGVPSVLSLPTDRPRPAVLSLRGESMVWHSPGDLRQGLQRLRQKSGSSFFTLCLTAFTALLSRWTRERELCVGTPVAGRNRTELENVIGLLLNTLALRADLSGNPRLSDLLKQLDKTTLDALANQDVPFGEVVREVHPERNESHTPLFQVLFSYQPVIVPTLRLPELTFSSLDVGTGGSQFDLIFLLEERGEELMGSLVYNRDLFLATTPRRFLRHFENVLRNLVEEPETRLDDVSLLSAPERQQVLREWNDTYQDWRATGTLHELFAAQARRTPGATALAFEQREMSYGELEAKANQLAHHLLSLGLCPGEMVGVCLPRSPEMVVAVLAALKAGGGYVPLDGKLPAERLGFMIEDAGVRLLVGRTGYGPAELGETTRRVLLDQEAEALGRHGVEPPAPVEPCNFAYVIFTSGSTGKPKGVLVRHEPAMRLIDWVRDKFAVDADDRMLFVASLSFDLSVYDIFGILAAGGSIRIASAEDMEEPERLVRWLQEDGITFWDSAPAALQQLAPLFPEPGKGSASLRRVFLSGDWIPVTLPDRLRSSFPRARVIALGGATECTVWSNSYPVGRVDPAWPSIPYGRPMTNACYLVLGPGMRPCPIGVPGDLCIGGRCLAGGYASAPALSAERFVPDPFSERPGARLYRTGDLARFWNDGNLEFLGREDAQVKVRGFRIELGEIATALIRHEAVRDAVAVVDGGGATAQRMGRLVAYVVPRSPENPPGVEDLRVFLSGILPEYMMPSAFVLLDEVPLTSNGKLDRKALPSPSRHEETPGPVAAPSTPAEETLAGIWRQVLGLEEVGVHDNFFEVGGDSILSIQVVSRARAAGLRLSPRQVFQNPTIAEQAAVAAVADEGVDEEAPVTGPVPLTPIQRSFFAARTGVQGHYNQAVLLAPLEPLDAGRLAAASRALVEHHDALRLHFFQDEAEAWHQESRAEGGPFPCAVVDLSRLPSERQTGALGPVADAAHRGFDLSRGALQRLVLVELGAERGQRLLWVIHHLAVDGVSWRVLLADLESGYRRLEAGEAPALPPRTASFGRWARALEELGRSGAFTEELDFWSSAGRPGAPLPVDDPGAANTMATTRSVEVSLSEEETRALLSEVPPVYRTNVDEVLLAALVSAFRKWTGERGLRLALESHGREEDLVGGLDLSRTVGWFTSLYPVFLEAADGGPGETLKAVKERLRSVPHHGVGYGVLRYLGSEEARRQLSAQSDPEVIFNYLGQLDTALTASFWRPAEERSGARADSRGQRESLVEVSGGVQAGRLRLRWEHGARHRRETVEALAQGYLEALRTLIGHCRTVGFGGYTPSDFPLAGLDQKTLDALLESRGPVEDLYPLTPMQQGMLIHTLREPGSGTYVEQLSATLSGRLDPERLCRAWRSVVRRHPVLRTAFLWEGLEEPLQAVLEEPRLDWREEDWRDLPASERRERLDAELEEDVRRGFDVGEAPLMRILLIRAGEESWHFVWSFHHLLFDGWSSGLVFQDALAFYRGQELPPAAPFRDYVAWLGGRDLAETEAFWRRTLAGFTTPTLLAEGRRGDTSDLSAYRRRELHLDPEATEALRALAARRSLTLNTLVQGAWSLLLAGTTGRRDVLFGATVSGRSVGPEGRESMVGVFINTLPVRARVEAAAECFPWLTAQQAAHAEAREHEHGPLERVQVWSGFGAGEPLFDHILVFENFPVGASLQEDGDLKPSDVRVFERTNYPLTVDVVPEPTLLVKLSYEASLFEDTAVRRMLGHLGNLLRGLQGEPRRLSELSLLGPAERHQVLVEWNVTPPSEAPELFVELFARQAGATPEAVAAVCGERRLTYRELDHRTHAVARRLAAAGVDGETVVAILAERGIDFLLAVLSIWKAGGAYLPLDPRHPAERHRQVLGASGSPLVLVSRQLLPSLTETLGEPAACGVLVLEDLVAEAGESSAAPLLRGALSNLAYVIYTSGSTGLPKGAMVEQRGMVNHLRAKVLDLGLASGDRVAQNASQCFDISVWQFLAALLVGGRVVIYPDEVAHDPARLLAAVREDDVTILEVVPSLMQMMIAGEEEPAPLPRLRWLVPTGEALPVELARRWHRVFPQIPLINAYGPTECSDDVTHHVLQGPVGADVWTIPIGRPVLSLRLFVLAPDFSPLPLGRPGELFVAGIGVGRGYLRDPRRTAEVFVPNPFDEGGRLYRTGDLGRFTAEGVLEFLGRIDHQVKIRGFRIELEEIEVALSRHGDVDQAVVVVQERRPGSEHLVAWLVARPGRRLEEGALRELLQKTLPEYMVPAFFVTLDALPVTANGKVDRAALGRKPLPKAAGAALRPRTAHEEIVAGIWSEVLGVEEVGVDDDFFGLGGHSLLATQVVSRLRRDFEVEIPLQALFDSPTVAGLSRRVEEEAKGALPPVTPVPRGGDLPLSFSQQGLWFLDQLSRKGARTVPSALRLSGQLDVPALHRSLETMVSRHESLRTVFPAVAGKPRQRILASQTPSLPLVDLGALPADVGEVELRRLFLTESGRSYDLANGPLFRCLLARLDDDEHAFSVNMHHIVSDGRSMEVFNAELAACYEAFVRRRPPELPALALQYVDFTHWQQQRLTGEALEEDLAYWRRQLAHVEPLRLPTDRPRRPEARRGRGEAFSISGALRQGLEALSRRAGVTLFMTLLAAFQTLLHRYTGQDAIAVGTPSANRSRPEFEPIVGFFVNTLVLHVDFSGGPDFLALLERVRRSTLGAYEHQDLPFERLTEDLQSGRDTGFQTLFQVMFAFWAERGTTFRLPGLTFTSLPFWAAGLEAITRLDLSFDLTGHAEEVRSDLWYNYDLFDRTSVQRLLRHLTAVLQGVVEDAARPVSALPLLASSERHQLLVEWPARASGQPQVVDASGRPAPIGVWGRRQGEEAGAEPVPVRYLGDGRFESAPREAAAEAPAETAKSPRATRGGLAERRAEIAARRRRLSADGQARLADRLRGERAAEEARAAELLKPLETSSAGSLVPLRSEGREPPLYCFHAVGGTVFSYQELAGVLRPEQPVYGFQALGLDGQGPVVDDIAQMAAGYLEIVREQNLPEPRRLLGWCFGGVLAFEMAKQLMARGASPTLMLIDTLLPDPEDSDPDDLEILDLLIRDLGGGKLVVELDELRALEPGARVPYVLEKAHATGFFPMDVRTPQIRRLIEVQEAALRAMARYRPEPYPGGLTLFCSETFDAEGRRQIADRWSTLCTGPVTVEALAGDHFTILAQPHVEVLAARLEALFGGSATP